MDGGQVEAAADSLAGLKSRARALSGDAAVRAWRDVLVQSAGDREAHKALSGLLFSLDRHAEAIVHLRTLIERTPGNGAWWMALAKALQASGDLAAAADAWLKAWTLKGLKPLELQAFARLLKALGRSDELRRLAEVQQEPGVWTWVALDAAESGRWSEAEAAWDKVIELGGNVWAFDERDRLRHRARRAATTLNVTVIGNCQAFAIAGSLRRLLPDADVASWVPGVHREPELGRPDWLPERLASSELVVTQRLKWGRLPAELETSRRPDARVVVVPRIAFTGFHPDIVRLAHTAWPVPAVFRPYHSGLIAAAWLNGVPKDHAPELFNAYVFARLGYFDEFERARRYLLGSGEDLDLSGMFDAWARRGTFVHIPVHPKIEMMHDLARAACAAAGLKTSDEGPGPDHQAENMVWPVYPEIARRLGVEGSFRFHPRRGMPWIGLQETIEHFYGLYEGVDPSVIGSPEVTRIAQVLKDEGCC